MIPRSLQLMASFLRAKSLDDVTMIEKVLKEIIHERIRQVVIDNAYDRLPILVNYYKPETVLDSTGISDVLTKPYHKLIHDPDLINLSRFMHRFIEETLHEFNIHLLTNPSLLSIQYTTIGNCLMVSAEPLCCNQEHLERYRLF